MRLDMTMEILQTTQKGPIMYTYEKFSIHKNGKIGPILNKQYITAHNILFDVLINEQHENCNTG
jgi:hypothetical protein